MERRQLEFDRRQAQSRFKMPFAGQLIASVQLAEGVTEYPVSAGQELAVVRDLEIRSAARAFGGCLLDGAAHDATNRRVASARRHAVGGAICLQKTGALPDAREEVFYYFQFPFEESASAAQLVGTDLSCELWLGLTQPARIVPKLALVLHEPAAFQNRHWNEGIARILPGAQVMVEGQTDLAILPPVPQQERRGRRVPICLRRSPK